MTIPDDAAGANIVDSYAREKKSTMFTVFHHAAWAANDRDGR
jgi:hypothetical protein